MQTFDDLMRAVLAVLPDATLDTDGEGQIIVNTNLAEIADGSGTLTRFDPESAMDDE